MNKNEFHDACGTGFIVALSGKPEKRILYLSLKALQRLSHRGAISADNETGDGAGILTDIPKPFFREVIKSELNIKLPFRRPFGVGMIFTSHREFSWLEESVRKLSAKYGFNTNAVREVPVNENALGKTARKVQPLIVQFFFTISFKEARPIEARLYLLRKAIENEIRINKKKSYICSLSSKTIVYKGLMTSTQLDCYYSDLTHKKYIVKLALFHERFSTNTQSTWAMSQPFRMLAHNGEINTIKGNRLWMNAREKVIESRFWKKDIEVLKPIVSKQGSDSASMDNILEFLTKSNRNMFRNIMMLVPDPYEYSQTIPAALKNFFIYHENFMEPWDGPAALVFTDGNYVAAKMDRNGLRPLRYTVTKDGLVILASEAGVVDVEDKNLLVHHHMTSGEIFAVSLKGKGILLNDSIKRKMASEKPYSKSLRQNMSLIKRKSTKCEFGNFEMPTNGFDSRLRIAFGWSSEDLNRYLIPMATSGREPMGSMGDDTPPAVLSQQDRRFYDYFKQSFAQVTNPPIDSIRERGVMSLVKNLGSENNLLDDNPTFGGALRINSPILSPLTISELFNRKQDFPHKKISTHIALDQNMERRLITIKKKAKDAIEDGAKIIFLTDENLKRGKLPLPMPLIVSTIHHYLVKCKMRSQVSLISITGDVVEDHHIAVLIGLGASAVYPYMAYELIREHFDEDENWTEKMGNYQYALEKGLLKIMGKMGISALSSYHGSMLFHAFGLDNEFLKKYFPSIQSKVGGIGLIQIYEMLKRRHDAAFKMTNPKFIEKGFFRFRRNGEKHGFAPDYFKPIRQRASQNKDKQIITNDFIYLRDLILIKSNRKSIKPDQVDSVEKIIKRFGSGAISFGAISEESHRVLARGMALAGARSNTGEGGEMEDRYNRSNPEKGVNSYIKQVASGRFGVTVDYLAAAREIQVKMAQGAKPGEGGQLPGHKVSVQIAQARSATPGVPLISPPPHHDIYSIEDIKQLIHDLKEVNIRAKVSVKLVAQPGIGTVASGVVKAGADIILISGGDGGTGASPLGSLKHTGFPWELGLAEIHQTLVANGLRERVVLRVDGGLRTATDIVMAAIMGAEEFDFGTSALVALGCIMARQCHLNTCPAGIATQDEQFIKKFRGKPEDIQYYLVAIAESVQSQIAELGFQSLYDIIGRTDLLAISDNAKTVIKEKGLDLSFIMNPNAKNGLPLMSPLKVSLYGPRNDDSLDDEILNEVHPSIMTHGHAVVIKKVNNTMRSIGTRISGEIAFLYGKGNFNGNIQIRMGGAAGQSFGAYLTEGVELRLKGVANDYVGKGLSGGLISVRMPRAVRRKKGEHTIIGNVGLYGATGGHLFVAGRGGERFAVRNSGAVAVIEGIGNHGCEYMTRGTVIVLGDIGANFGAGMTGGQAFIYVPSKSISKNLNTEYVDEGDLTKSDVNLLYRLLRNHEFHTGSIISKKIMGDWKTHQTYFRRITPVAIEIVDFQNIYDMQVADRLGVMLNE
ncbi:MAG: glutamate synthase large subunit [Candidatus Marinimicrobia bacterium]|nr:glutamate synthase large subunit [Candidatus Neomarinimicrobiota bacterium]MBL7010548.1 glutamate synthase large subunit [Candidatus Neomarinimicrobiota bacterium]